MTEEDILFRVKLDQLQQKLTQKVTEDAKKVSDEDIQAYYDEEQEALRPAGAPRPARGPHEDRGQGQRRPSRRSSPAQPFKKVVKQYSIDEASKAQGGLLPAVAKGQQEKAFDDGDLRGQEGQARGPGEDPVRLVRLRGREGHQGLAADARAVQGDDQEPAALAAPAEGARRVHQVLPRGLQGRDGLRRRLPRGRVQERSEGRDRTPAPPPAATRARSRSSRPSPQPTPTPADAPQQP